MFPGGDMLIALTVGLVLCMFNALAYSLMSAAMPRSGGHYVWVSSLINPYLGFTVVFANIATTTIAMGMYSGMTSSYGVSQAFVILGLLSGNPTLTAIGRAAHTTNIKYLLGSFFIWISVVIFVWGAKVIKWFLWSVFIVAMGGTLVGLFVFLPATHEGFVASFNALMASSTNSPDSYNLIINTARQAGFGFPVAALIPSILALPIGYWAFVGFTNSSLVAGEVKTPARSQPIAMLGTLIVAWGIFGLMVWKFYQIVGWDFTNAVAYLYFETDKYMLPAPPAMNLFIGLVSGNFLVNAIIGVSFILWIFMLVGPLFLTSSRMLFAASYARALPEALTKVTKNGSPWVAVVVAGLIAQFWLTLWSFTHALGIANFTLILAIATFIGGLSAIALPYKNKSLFEASPGIVKKRIAGFPLVVIAGIMNTIFFAFIIIFSATNSAFSGPIGLSAYTVVVGVFVLGAIYYAVARAIRKRQGIDLNLIWKEVPPE